MSTKIGLDRILFQLGVESPAGYMAGLHIRFAGPLLQFQTYSQDWVDYYTDNAYVHRDPMIAWGFTEEGSIRRSAITLPDPFDIWPQAATFGLKYGVAVAYGPMSSRSIIGCARSDRDQIRNVITAATNSPKPSST